MPFNLQTLLGEVIKNNASDLHICTGEPPAIRVNGKLRHFRTMPPLTESEVWEAFKSVLTEKQIEKYKTTSELDFSLLYKGPDGETARFRGNIYFSLQKMAGAFRLVPSRIKSITDLGLPNFLKHICQIRRGLFLVVGPTGHGKSTTLAAMVDEINNTREDHILTIEDPVEFVHKSVKCLINQREVGTDTASFAEGLRRALRQDPDVLLIGELRDLETISAALTASETGHLVFGTLHTQDASQSIDRIIDVFPHNFQLQIRMQMAAVLLGICSQQLVPKKSDLGEGRVCATELLIATPAVRNCIREGKNSQLKTMLQTGMSSGMHSMEQSLATLIRNNVISLETALAYAYDTKELQRLLTT